MVGGRNHLCLRGSPLNLNQPPCIYYSTTKMSRFTAVSLLLLLLLSCPSSRATRPAPLTWKNTSPENQHPGDEIGRPETMDHEDCKAGGDEECLMRRTLAAHVDYIYTQKHQP